MLVSVKEHKLVVVGPRKVGKTALVVRFLTKRFICEYVENSDMSWKRETMVEGEHLKVHIQDTSDNGMTQAAIEQHFQWADAILLIYSITDVDGFEQIKTIAMSIMDKVAELDEKEQSLIPPLVLVGNKGDLEFARKVSRQDGFHLSKKLRCEFFEASAREGWSKLLSPSSSPFMSFSSSSDYEVSNIFPAATETIRSKSPTSLFKLSSPKRRVSPNRSDKNKFVEKGKNEFSFNRYGKQSPRSVRRSGRSFSVAGSDTVSVPISHVSNTIPRLNSFPISSTFSEEDSDDTRPSTLSPPTGRKLSTHERLIGRLSPRLGRKLMKSNRTDECNNSAKDNNNNQNSGRSYDRLSFGFPNNKSDNKLKVISDEAPIPQITICCHSNSSSSANSIFGSTDSLLVIDHDKDDRVSDRYTANNPPLSPPEVFPESFNEHEFSSSEPFLLVCRSKQTQQRPRPRSRSPSHKIMNGLKKIRSLASDHTSGQGNNAVKHQNSTLMLPTFNH